MALKEDHRWYNIKMEDDTWHRLKMKGRKSHEVSGSLERGKVCFKGNNDGKYRHIPCL